MEVVNNDIKRYEMFHFTHPFLKWNLFHPQKRMNNSASLYINLKCGYQTFSLSLSWLGSSQNKPNKHSLDPFFHKTRNLIKCCYKVSVVILSKHAPKHTQRMNECREMNHRGNGQQTNVWNKFNSFLLFGKTGLESHWGRWEIMSHCWGQI